MATRDRTALFLRYREEARALHRRKQTSETSPDSNDFYHNDINDSQHTSNIIVRKAGMEPEWLFSYNELKADIAEMEKKLDQISALYAKHLLPSFGDTDTSEIEHDIRLLSHRLNELLHSVEQKLRAISRQNERDTSTNDVEKDIRTNIQKRFATPLQQISILFRKKQKRYLEKLKEMREAYSEPGERQQSAFLIEDNEIQSNNLPNSQLSQHQMLTVENASALAQERTRELNRVAANINDLATLVKDIASLVVDQGTVLDRIDYNLEETKVKTNSAVRELRIADRYQRKRYAFCCIIVLAIACAVMFIILVFKWTSS